MIITFDVGGTSIKYGVVEFKEDEIHFLMKDEADTFGGQGILKTIEEKTQEAMQSYPIEGLAISTAGRVDVETGTILLASNIPDYTGMCVKGLLEEKFHLPVWVENDVNSAALGETMYGAGKNASSSFMVTIGTGIGGAIVLDQKVFHGFTGVAGEVCFMNVKGQDYQDLCSTTALVHKVEERTHETGLNGRIIFDRAKAGDAICKEVIEEICSDIVLGLNNCLCMVNPEVIILGGGIMSQEEYLRPIMEKYLKKHVNPIILKGTRLEFASLQNMAGMAGAAAFWKSKEQK